MIISLQKKIDVQIKFKKNYTSNAIDEPFKYEIKKFKLKINKNLNDNLRYFYLYNGIKIGGPMFFYIIKNEKAIKEINIYQPIKTIEKELKDNIIFISPEKIEVINNEKNTENNDENNNKKINGISDKISKISKDESNNEKSQENNDKMNKAKINEISNEINNKNNDVINNENNDEISNEKNKGIIKEEITKNNDEKYDEESKDNDEEISEKNTENSDENNNKKTNISLIEKNNNKIYMHDNYITNSDNFSNRSGREMTQNEQIYNKNDLTKPVSEKRFHSTKKNKICLIAILIYISYINSYWYRLIFSF